MSSSFEHYILLNLDIHKQTLCINWNCILKLKLKLAKNVKHWH